MEINIASIPNWTLLSEAFFHQQIKFLYCLILWHNISAMNFADPIQKDSFLILLDLFFS